MNALSLLPTAAVSTQQPATPRPPDVTRLAELAVGLGAWGDDQQDPADSLWRAARRAFNRGEYGSAANLFGEITRRYAASSYAGDAHYWGAFALYRTGDDQGLRTALTLLDSQQRRYPQARTKRDACSAALRRKAVFILSQKRTEDVEDILLDVARNDPDHEVREQAVFWLSQVPSERAVEMLDSILRTSPDEEIQKKAVFALSQKHSPRAGEILRAYAERPGVSDEVRAQIIFWLGQRPGAENAAFLRGLYAKLTDDDLKEKVIF